MKLHRSLLLGSAATLVAVAGAQAADLPVRAAAPVEYVRVCSTYGAGFFYIPGTDTCLRVGGRARAEYQYISTRAYAGANANGDNSGFRGLGRLNLDARTATDFGTVRTFVRFEIAGATGGYIRSGSQERQGVAYSATGIDTFGRAQQQVQVEKAFIQFAGITAGRAASFYDFYAHDLEFNTATQGSDMPYTNLFAYTATLGEGLTATLSVEDPTYRRQPIYSPGAAAINTGGTGVGTSVVNTAFFTPVGVTFDPVTGLPTTFVNLDTIQRNRTPDVVGVLRLDQSWGSAQISAAMHEINTGRFAQTAGATTLFTASALAAGAVLPGTGGLVVGPAAGAAVPGVAATPAGLAANTAIAAGPAGAVLAANPVRVPSAEYGFAVQGGLKINLPELAQGDVFWLQAAYSEGALSYTGTGVYPFGRELVTLPIGGRFQPTSVDAVVDAGGRLRLTESASITAAFLHYWTPQVRQAVFGSYAYVDYASSLRNGNGPANIALLSNSASAVTRTTFQFNPTFKDYDLFTVGSNLIYSPVKDLDIGVEVAYTRLDIQGRVNDANKNPAGTVNAAGVPVRTVSFDDFFLTRLRIQRDF